ncbi:MAG: phasin family protein [Pseudomonadota bacterium]|nr:phasin family protein [Pseudomonadota bacterium]
MADKKTAAKGAKARPAKAAASKASAKTTSKAAPATAATIVASTRKAPARKAAPAPVAAAKAVAPKAVAPKPAVQKPVAARAAAQKAVTGTVITAAETTSKINERTTDMQNETTKMINDRTQALFGDMNGRAKETVERSTKIVEEMTDLTRGNVEAIVASSKVAARGIETLSQEVAEFGRRSFEEASAAVKNIAEVRSATDFFRLQSDYARTAFDSMIAESSKMSEAMMKLAGEVAEPITSRYSVAAERVKNIAA